MGTLPHFTVSNRLRMRRVCALWVCVFERKFVSLCTKIQIENLSRIENIKSFDKPYRMCASPGGKHVGVCVCARRV